MHFVITNVVRQVSVAIYQGICDKKNKNSKLAKDLFLGIVFENNEDLFKEFCRLTKFIRNVFSHNINDQIKLEETTYDEQKKYLAKEGAAKINFSFNYKDYKHFKDRMQIKPNTDYIVDININFEKMEPGKLYNDVINEYQNLMFIEFCYNCILLIEK